MALTKFVRNVKDLSDDGGFKFRFHCDKCNDGVESQYVSSASNILKTGLEVFSMFRVFGGHSARAAARNVDRGLRGKERDAAYETAIHEALAHFNKCTACGKYVCAHCWNAERTLCESCAPDEHEAAGQAAARRAARRRVDRVEEGEEVRAASCVACGESPGSGKFCQSCGVKLGVAQCKSCKSELAPRAKFCGECGTPSA